MKKDVWKQIIIIQMALSASEIIQIYYWQLCVNKTKSNWCSLVQWIKSVKNKINKKLFANKKSQASIIELILN